LGPLLTEFLAPFLSLLISFKSGSFLTSPYCLLDAVAKNLTRLFSQGVNWPVNSRGHHETEFSKGFIQEGKVT
jgi:hypothetical protein